MALRSQPEHILDVVRGHERRHPAFVDANTGQTVTYGELAASIESVAAGLLTSRERRLHFLFSGNDIRSITTYLGCLAADTPVCLLDCSRSPAANRIIDAYGAAVVLAPPEAEVPERYKTTGVLPSGYEIMQREGEGAPVHEDLALLLTTSGSTGDPKLVRLTYRNVFSNAIAIAEYLKLGPSERAIQSLPVYYSYGLSVINSHLVTGGTVVLTQHSFMRPEFWANFRDSACTSFAGVPHMYETLKRLKFDPALQPSLRTLTQAGGKLNENVIEWYSQVTARSGRQFFVMYGQTEATARMSYVPAEQLSQKIGSIGIAIPGGTLSLAPVPGSEDLQEIVYQGPNVMMGYADGANALSQGDELGGVLRTGDLGRVDSDGYFYIAGRLKRFAKLFGKRVNLADVEAALETQYPVRAAAVDSGRDHLLIFLEHFSDIDDQTILMNLAKDLAVPPSAIRLNRVDALPMTSSGKKDYAAVARM